MRQVYKPVRKISRSKSSLRGIVQNPNADQPHSYESGLERDFFQILEFDNKVHNFCEQPVCIEYEQDGAIRSYTPDVLVFYVQEGAIPVLYEVKYRKDLKENWALLKPKFKAAVKYAAEKGWKFKIITEKEIRTDFLQNTKFLLPYKTTKHTDIADFTLLRANMKALSESTPEEIILYSSSDKNKRAELLYCLWHMLATGYIGCDIKVKLNMQSKIWAI